MNEKNIETIKDQQVSLGLPAEIEYDLRVNICLQQDQFQVSYRQIKDMDIMNSVFYFEKKESEYCCSYYEACLRRKIFVPEILVNEIDVIELDERMTKIDWQNLLSKNSGRSLQSENKFGWQREEEIEKIVSDIKKISVSADGLQVAERLKIKFWLDTLLVFLIPNVGVLKNQYEISQRFYFFQDEEQISLGEAYRFLTHRWREKQLNAKKKQTESDGPETEPAVTATKGKRILVKRKNNKRKQQKNK